MQDPRGKYGLLFDTNIKAKEFAAMMRGSGYRSRIFVNRGNGTHGLGVNYSVISEWPTVQTIRKTRTAKERVMDCVNTLSSSRTSQAACDKAIEYLLKLAELKDSQDL